jgi:hypothetical protein
MRTIGLSTISVAVAMTLWGAAAGAQELTVRDVDSFQPFGEIDVTLTMVDPRTITAWAGGLSPERQAELRARCEIIVENGMRYDIAHRTFCTTYLEG